jgi:DnaD/phage-associated family protein
MSESTIKRTILGLEKQGIIIVGTFNKHAWDKTKWYTLNYNKLSEIAEERTDEFGRPSDQIDPIDDTNLTSSDGTNLTQPIPLDYTENTHKITNNNPRTNSSVVPVVSDEAVLVFEREVMGRPLTQMETEQILDLEKDYGRVLLYEAVKRAVAQSKRTIRYIAGILRIWRDEGVRTFDEVQAYERERDKQITAAARNRTKAKGPGPGDKTEEKKPGKYESYYL